MMKKVLLGGLFGGACFVAGGFALLMIEYLVGTETRRELFAGEKELFDLNTTELGLLIMTTNREFHETMMNMARTKSEAEKMCDKIVLDSVNRWAEAMGIEND